MTDYYQFTLNTKIRYDTEVVTEVKKKFVAVYGKNTPVYTLIQIPEKVKSQIKVEEKERMIDFIEEKVEVLKGILQQTNNEALNKEDSGNDYIKD